MPRLYRVWVADQPKVTREKKLEKDMTELDKKYNAILQSSRQIFSIAINCLQKLNEIKTNNYIDDKIGETIEEFKIQLGKYHKILLGEVANKNEMFSEAIILEHKRKLIEAKSTNNIEGMIEILLSLRVNALQVSYPLRRNLVSELIRNDVLMITEDKSNSFILDLISIPSHSLKHALCALMSIITSIHKGIEYLVENGFDILQKVIDIVKEQEDGSVTQRFCIALLQKMSIKEELIDVFVKNKIIDWITKLLETSLTKDIHIFSLNFGSALLANILHSGYGRWGLENDLELVKTKHLCFIRH